MTLWSCWGRAARCLIFAAAVEHAPTKLLETTGAPLRIAAFLAVLVGAPTLTWAADTLPFEIQNARGPAGLVVAIPSSAPTTQWSRVLRLVLAPEATQPQSTDQLKISGMVETDQGEQAIVTAGQMVKVELAAGAFVEVTVAATLQLDGVYKGELLLIQGAKQRVVPLQITVSPKPKPAPVELPIASIGGTAIKVTGGSGVKVPVLVHNMGSAPLKVEATVVAVTRVDKADNPTIRVAIPDAQTRETAKPIAAGSIEKFELDLSHLDDAGIYSVEAVFQHVPGDGTYQPKSIVMTVYKRDYAWLAALCIAIGAALAWFIRWFVSDGNDRLTARGSFALLSEQVRTFRTGVTQEQILIAARALELDTADRQRELRWGGKVDAANVALKRGQIRFALLQEVAEAQSVLAKLSGAGQEGARKTIDLALSYVRVDPATDEKLAECRQRVKDLALRAAWREQLGKQLAEIRAAISRQKPVAGAALSRDLLAIEQALGSADSLLAGDSLDKADELVRAQRDALVVAGVGELRRVADKAKVPAGVQSDAWTTVAEELQAHADDAAANKPLDARLDALQAGQCLYFKTIATGLAALATSKASKGDSRADQLQKMAAELLAVVPRDPFEAGALAAKHASEIAKPDPKGVSKGQVGTETGASPLPTSWLPLVLSTMTAVFKPSAAPASADRLRAEIGSYRWLTNAAVFTIAVATGIKVLYLDNPAWGGWPAYLLAFLWGAGIQVTGDTFAGIVGTRAKLGGLPAA